MRRKLVAGNWKMHGSRQFVEQLIPALDSGLTSLSSDVDVAVAPTLVHLALAEKLLTNTRIALAAQNVYFPEQGAYTGEVSASMLAEYAVRYVIVGHSERRQIFAESNELVAKKFEAVQGQQMIPVLCLGETLEQRESGAASEIVLTQLDDVLQRVGTAVFANAVIAYEPVWAIGTGQTATPEQAQEMHQLIRQHLGGLDQQIADDIRILYGGSVNRTNAAELFAQPDIDGGLVGGAALKVEEFISICASADE